MSSIFISHSHKDKPFVEKAARDVEHFGHTAWVDAAEIGIGDSLLDKISNAITKVDYVVAVISDNSINSAWVQHELRIAMTRELGERRLVVLPIILTRLPLPAYLHGKKYVDLTDKTYSKGLLELLRSIAIAPRQLIEPRDLVDPPPQQVHLGRYNLKVDGFAAAFSFTYHAFLSHDNLTEISITPGHVTGAEDWSREEFEGFICACMYFIKSANSVLLPDVPDATANASTLSIVMAFHEAELWQNNFYHKDPDINAKRIAWFDKLLLDLRGYAVGRDLAIDMLRWCPAREVPHFYIGWHYFCVSLQLIRQDSGTDHESLSTRVYIATVCNLLLGHMRYYEFKYEHVSWSFWLWVKLYVAALLFGDQEFRSFVIEDVGIPEESLPDRLSLVKNNEDQLKIDMEEKLQILPEVKTRWRRMAESTQNVRIAIEIIMCELRMQYEFAGRLDDTTGEVTLQVLRR